MGLKVPLCQVPAGLLKLCHKLQPLSVMQTGEHENERTPEHLSSYRT